MLVSIWALPIRWDVGLYPNDAMTDACSRPRTPRVRAKARHVEVA